MNKLIAASVLCAALSGCWLVEKQHVLLDPQQVAALEASLGQVNKQNLEAWIAAASLATKSDVENVTKTTAGVVLQLKAPLEEAGVEAGESLLQSAASNPTPAGIVAGIPAAVLAMASVLARRARMKEARGAK